MKDKIAKLAALEAKSTPRPWSVESHECLNIKAPQGHTLCRMCWLTDKGRVDDEEGHANAALIVTMRNALPELLREWRALRAAKKTLVNQGYTYHGGILWKPPAEELVERRKVEAERDVLARAYAKQKVCGQCWRTAEDCITCTRVSDEKSALLSFAAQEAAKSEGGAS